MVTSRIRVGRILVAAIMSEIGVIAVLFAAITVYARLTPVTEAEYAALGEQVGYYVAPTAGAVTTFLAVLWATRRLTADFVRHGVLVGVVSVVLTIGFVFGARPEHRLMYVIAFALRIIAGYGGGLFAQRKFASPSRGSVGSLHGTSR